MGAFLIWCGRRDSNPHGFPHGPEPCASANSATTANRMFRKRQAFPPIEHSILYNIFCTIATKRFAKCRQNSRKCTKEFHKAIRYHPDTVIPFLLSLLYTLRLTSAYITENSGMNRMIPNTPDTLPPTTTASSVHSAGSPTELPTTFGYTMCPSICCIMKKMTMNQNACLRYASDND